MGLATQDDADALETLEVERLAFGVEFLEVFFAGGVAREEVAGPGGGGKRGAGSGERVEPGGGLRIVDFRFTIGDLGKGVGIYDLGFTICDFGLAIGDCGSRLLRIFALPSTIFLLPLRFFFGGAFDGGVAELCRRARAISGKVFSSWPSASFGKKTSRFWPKAQERTQSSPASWCEMK